MLSRRVLLLSSRHALTLLVVGFGLFWLYEHRVLGPDSLPPAYLRLRRSLSLAVDLVLPAGGPIQRDNRLRERIDAK